MKNNNQLEKYNPGFFQNISLEIRLILRLMGDRRVPFYAKLLPVGVLVYGLVPDFFPVIDDAILFGVGYYAFTAMCPPDVVAEHRNRLLAENGFAVEAANQPRENHEDVSEADFREVDHQEGRDER